VKINSLFISSRCLKTKTLVDCFPSGTRGCVVSGTVLQILIVFFIVALVLNSIL